MVCDSDRCTWERAACATIAAPQTAIAPLRASLSGDLANNRQAFDTEALQEDITAYFTHATHCDYRALEWFA